QASAFQEPEFRIRLPSMSIPTPWKAQLRSECEEWRLSLTTDPGLWRIWPFPYEWDLYIRQRWQRTQPPSRVFGKANDRTKPSTFLGVLSGFPQPHHLLLINRCCCGRSCITFSTPCLTFVFLGV